MTKMHKKLLIIPIALGLLILNGILVEGENVRHIELQYAVDFFDDKVLVGASHNIFVGKVVKEIGLKERGLGPETHFLVEVIENVKGDLNGRVIVNQQGGYKDGFLHVTENELVGDTDQDPYMLQPGWTYVFATRTNKKGNWHTLNPHPAALRLLTPGGDFSNDQLKELVGGHWRVRQLKEAYPNEIVIDADIKNNYALNNFKSLKAKEIR